MTNSDLNQIRDAIIRAQQSGSPYPDQPESRITVTRYGEVRVGSHATDAPVSKLHHGTFAVSAAERLRYDQAFVARHMPPGTRYIDTPAARGWAYQLTTELGQTYSLFAFFDGRDYKVKLIEPPLEGRINPHDGHLYRDGTICLSDRAGAGQPTLEEAYSKSALWALGIGFVLDGQVFPFSINNLNG